MFHPLTCGSLPGLAESGAPIPTPAAPAPAARVPLAPRQRLLRLLAPQRFLLLGTGAAALALALLGIAAAAFLQRLIDTAPGALLSALGIGLVLFVGFRGLCDLTRLYLMARIRRRVEQVLCAGYVRHVLALPLRYFEMQRAGEILSRIDDAVAVRTTISGAVVTAVLDGTLVLLFLGVLWLHDPPLALAATALLVLLMAGVLAQRRTARRHSRKLREHSALLTAHLAEDIAGIETVKVCGAEPLRSAQSEARLGAVLDDWSALQKLQSYRAALGTCALALAGVAVLWLGGRRVMDGALSLGELLFASFLLGSLLGPLQRLRTLDLQFHDALAALQRLYQVLDLEAEPLQTPRKLTFAWLHDSVELQDVSFRYGGLTSVLERVSLRIPTGRTVAIVGPSGAGKSTLLKLLVGLEEPSAGRIRIDGVELCDFHLESLRRRIALVTHDTFLFHGSIWDNLVLGAPEATFDEIAAATHAAGLDDFIDRLPRGYDTLLGAGGVYLSAGQRQQLAIARALLRQPEILILDEATSQLDTAAERALHHRLRRLLPGKTIVLVTHRLRTARGADLIYVLQQGRLVEEGNHRQLMVREAAYWSLWRDQLVA